MNARKVNKRKRTEVLYKKQSKLKESSNSDKKNKKKRPQQQKNSLNKKKRRKKNMRKKKRKNKWLERSFSLLFYLIIVSVLFSTFIFSMSKSNDKTIFGYRIFGVLTNSMVKPKNSSLKGGFYAGDVIVVKKIDGETAKKGDIITFRPSLKSEAFLTHRVKKKLNQLNDIQATYYITQGDANKSEDMPIQAKQVIGKKVFSIPKLGGILNFIKENSVISIVFFSSLIGFFIVLRYYLFS